MNTSKAFSDTVFSGSSASREGRCLRLPPHVGSTRPHNSQLLSRCYHSLKRRASEPQRGGRPQRLRPSHPPQDMEGGNFTKINRLRFLRTKQFQSYRPDLNHSRKSNISFRVCSVILEISSGCIGQYLCSSWNKNQVCWWWVLGLRAPAPGGPTTIARPTPVFPTRSLATLVKHLKRPKKKSLIPCYELFF